MSYLQDSATTRGLVTISKLQEMRQAGEKIAVLTAYDASFAALMAQAGVDVILIGDSLGNVVQGESSTLPVTLEHMVYHTSCVAKGQTSTFLIADMPFGSYSTPEQAMHNAAQLMRAGAHMVKLEGGAWLAETVKFLVERSVPVSAHLGLLPQSVHTIGGFKVQGRGEAADKILQDCLAIQEAGAFAVVLEMVPAELATRITKELTIPTIGIGAGNQTDAQILVWTDFAGLGEKSPSFAKQYLNLRASLLDAAQSYRAEIQSGEFPEAEKNFS